MPERLRHLNNLIAPFFALLIIGPIMWWLADREPPYTLSDPKLSADQIHAGEEFSIEWTLSLTRRGCEGSFARYIVDSHRVVWAFAAARSAFANMQHGRYRVNSQTKVTLPRGIAPGPAEVFTVTTFHCNPMQRVWPLLAEQPKVRLTILPPPPPLTGPTGPQGVPGERGQQGVPGERGEQGNNR